MRITQSSMNRRYLTNLNKNLSDMANTMNKLETGRGFTKMSESVTKGTRALSIRTQLYKNDQQQENIKTALEQTTVAEDNLTSIKDILSTVNADTVAALNGTNGQQEWDIYADNFDTMRAAMVQFANCTYDNKYTFGGTNNSTPPFTVGEDGSLLYNGVNVNDVTKTETGVFLDADGNKVPYSDSIYLDIGLGMRFSNGEIDSRTVFNSSVSGLDCLGFGTTELSYTDDAGTEYTVDAPNNVYELMGTMADALNDGDMDLLSALKPHLLEQFNNVVSSISDLGVRSNFLNTNLARLETESLTLQEIKGNVEGIEDAEEITNLSAYEYGYSLTLQFGSSVVPQSLMDYIS